MTINTNFEEFFKKVVLCLKNSKITYVIVGGISVIKYGRPRLTVDIDVVIEKHEAKIDQLSKCLQNNGFDYGIDDIHIALEEESLATILHSNFPYKLDIQGAYTIISRNALENRIYQEVFETEDTKAFLQKPEDLIIAKLSYAGGHTDRNQDFEDAKSVLLRQFKHLNMQYLNDLAFKTGLKNDLEYLCNEVKKLQK
ncbi:MAG: DUF6036 family nucleotidyltransferase [Candidatus Hodarchaeota archaeon]